MNLNITDWKEFKVGKIFDIFTTKLSVKDDLKEGNIPFISRTAMNNGCDGYVEVEEDKISKGNCLTIGAEGIYCFYQPKDFATGNKIYILRNEEMTSLNYFFIATILNKEDYKYSYGRARIKSKLEEEKIKLPVKHNSDGSILIDTTSRYSEQGFVPDWQFMEDYIKSLHHKPITTRNQPNNIPVLDISKWKDFEVGDLFPKVKVQHFQKVPEAEGNVPFVSSTSENNGVSSMVNESPIKGNCITVSTNGSCFDCFYQPKDFCVSNDAEVLYNENLNQYIGLFICSVLKQEQLKYSYGRKPKNDKVYETIIKLPAKYLVRDDGTVVFEKDGNNNYIPDWQYMENYIKSLPYGDKI